MSNSNKTKELIKIPISPFWSQMDALGHINNSVYFTYCEQARVSWFDRIGFGEALNGKSKFGPVVINASCTFHKPVVYPCDLIVTMNSGEVGRSSFMVFYEISDGEVIYTTGSSKIVWVDFEFGKSVELPTQIRELL